MHRMSTLIEKIDGWIGKTAKDFFGDEEADDIMDEAAMPIWKKTHISTNPLISLELNQP